MSADLVRTLKIKTGVVKRTLKDLEQYKTELTENHAKVEEIRKAEDQSMLKQWETVTSETKAMIPDTNKRLKKAVQELRECIEGATDDQAAIKSPEFAEAKKLLKTASENTSS